jgi:hypothetical protein
VTSDQPDTMRFYEGTRLGMIRGMPLKCLRDGIVLENLGVRVPWLIAEPELFQLVPETQFTRSVANWPMLSCTVLRINLVWGFNFVTHSDDRFIGVRYDSFGAVTANETFAAASTCLLAELGTPNCVNQPDNNLRWQDDWACVANSIRPHEEPDGREVLWHSLFVYALSADPKTLASQRGRPHGNRF